MVTRRSLLMALGSIAVVATLSQLPFQRTKPAIAPPHPSAKLAKYTEGPQQRASDISHRRVIGDAELLPRRLRILIILRGISFDTGYRGGAYSFERTYENFYSHMVEPWRQQGHFVDIGISTFDSEKMDKVKEVYSPVFLYTPGVPYSHPARTKVDSVIEGLQAAEEAGGSKRWDFIAVTRFDVELRQPITHFSIDFGKMNFPWPEKNPDDVTFEDLPRVGDGMQLFNSAYLGALLEGFRNIAQLARLVGTATYNNGHRILTVMDVNLNKDVHFLLNQTFRSIWMRANPVYRESVQESLVAVQPKLRPTRSLQLVGNPPVEEHRQPRFQWPKPNAESWVSRLDQGTIATLRQAHKLQHLRRSAILTKRAKPTPTAEERLVSRVAEEHRDTIDSLMKLGASS